MLVVQLKLLIGSLYALILVPATLGAAAIDLIFKSGRHGARFYGVLKWGLRVEEAIGLYSALEQVGS